MKTQTEKEIKKEIEKGYKGIVKNLKAKLEGYRLAKEEMKTKSEKQLEREIEDRYKEVRKTYEEYGKANNWEEKNIDRATKQEIDENDYETAILKAKLSGYRLAKQEFNKKVEKLKEEIEPILMIRTTFEDLTIKEQKDLIFEKINKIFKEEKLE